MQCKDLEFVLESEGLGTLSAEAREHLAECDSCQALLADFHSIVAVAQTIPAEVEPPARVWISLRSQLEAEGLIKEPVESVSWRESLRMLFRPRALATATAGLVLAAGTLYFTHKPVDTQQRIANAQPVMQPSQPRQTSPAARASVVQAPPAPVTTAEAPHAAAAMSPKSKDLAASPSDNLSTPLAAGNSGMLASDTTVDASFRDNLRTLNQFIAECQRHLKQNPQDELAREYLNMAYQQKADLLATMMDNGRSEH
jgi:hypothetical protein